MSRSNSHRKPLDSRASRYTRVAGSSKHQQIEIIVETLSGTAFEMTASPSETLLSIKSKIQHVEGIPVAHQHLIHNLKELQNDSATLSECGLKNGSKLKLVLSLRGGPISTRRIPVLSCSGDDFEHDFEPVPSGSHIVLLTQEGEYLSLLKMVKNEDGSFSPLKEDWPSPDLLLENNMSDFAAEEHLPLIMPAPLTDAREVQNAITRSKIEDLKQRIGNLSIKKKSRNLQMLPKEPESVSESELERKPLLPPICAPKSPNDSSDPLVSSSFVKQIHLNHFVLDNRPRTSPETLYVVGHNLNQAVQKEAKDMCRLLGEVRRRQWTKESAVEPQPPPLPSRPPGKNRCKVCRRRLNITNSHTCRCSGLFCASHRYAETHDCTFDYKADGRKYLSQTNPLVVLPKLPKI